jgi:hypothetical protein
VASFTFTSEVEILFRITSLVLFGNLYVAIRRRLERK